MIDEKLIDRLASAIGRAAAKIALLEGKPEAVYWQGVKVGLETALREARQLIAFPQPGFQGQFEEAHTSAIPPEITTQDPKVVKNAVILPARNPSMPGVPRPTVSYSKPVVEPSDDK